MATTVLPLDDQTSMVNAELEMVTQPEAWPGQCLDGRFEIVRLLGRGGGGMVFHVRDLAPTEPPHLQEARPAQDEYALKLLLNSSLPGTSQMSYRNQSLLRIIREYRLGSRMRDSRLVRAHLFGATALGYYFTMDLLKGGCLPNVGTQLPVPVAVGLILQLLSALDCLHHQNVVHRDIKGSNCLLTTPLDAANTRGQLPALRVTDFGISRRGDLSEDMPFGTVLGTRSFLAPESYDLGNLDPRVDLYATGVLLYGLLSGRHPLEVIGLTPTPECLRQPFVLRPVRELVPEVPPAVDQVVMGLLERDPLKRLRTAALAFRGLFGWWGSADHGLTLPALPPLHGSAYLSTPRFVGRTAELEAATGFLTRTLARAPAPAPATPTEALPPSILDLCGEAGVGKTRFLGQIQNAAARWGALVLVGQCKSDIGTAYTGIGNVLDALYREDRGEDLPGSFLDLSWKEDGAAHPELTCPVHLRELEHVPRTSEPRFALLEQEARDALEAITQNALKVQLLREQATALVLRIGRRRPLLIALEDSQWIDSSSMGLVEYMVRNVAIARSAGHPARIAFVFVHRPPASDNAVGWLEGVLARQAEYEGAPSRLRLEPLLADDALELVGSMLQQPVDEALSRFSRALFERTGTRPLLLAQVLRVLLQGGQLTEGMYEVGTDGALQWNGQFRLEPGWLARVPLPTSVHQALGDRASRLSVDTLRLLELASAHGKSFDVELISAAADMNPLDLLDFMDEAASSGFVLDVDVRDVVEAARQTRNRSYRFVHDGHRESLYQALSPEARQRCHLRLAAAIASLLGEGDKTAEDLTRHHLGAGDLAQAHRFAVLAGQSLLEKGFHERARDYYRLALETAEQSQLKDDPALRIPMESTLHERYADVCVASGDFETAERHYQARILALPQKTVERWDIQRRVAELNYRQQKYPRALQPLLELLEDIGESFPGGRLGALLGIAPRIVRIQACGRLPWLINQHLPEDPARAELRLRVWYAIAEAAQFVDFRKTMYAGSVMGSLSTRVGLTPLTPGIFAAWSLILSTFGQIGLSRAYARLAEEYLARVGCTDRAIQAKVYFLMVPACIFRGELGAGHQKEVGRYLAEGFKAAELCGDIQRQWLMRAVLSHYLMLSGRLESAWAASEEVIRLGNRFRLTDLQEYGRTYQTHILASKAFDPRALAILGQTVASMESCGDAMTLICNQSREALLRVYLSAGTAADLDQALARSTTWVERRFRVSSAYPLSLNLAIAAITLTDLDVSARAGAREKVRRLDRIIRKNCLQNPLETPLYWAARGAIDRVDGQTRRAARLFSRAISLAARSGLVEALVFIYRLGARVHSTSSAEGQRYARLNAEQTQSMCQLPGLSFKDLEAGNLGPPPALIEG